MARGASVEHNGFRVRLGGHAARWLAVLVVLFLAASGVLSGGVVAHAATTSPAAPTTQEGAAGGSADSQAVVVLDASYSMVETDVGMSRMDAAKRAVHGLVDALPDTAKMGLVTYGSVESNAPENHERGCRDIKTLIPVGTVDKSGMNSAVDALQPTGYTPIGNALKHAAEQMSGQGSRSIILVSDGIDTCAPPPACEVAKELKAKGVDLAVHTVGLKVDEAAKSELECIAKATGGNYLPADDADQLANSLKFLATRAVKVYKSAGTRFEYSPTPDDAPWLGEGLYRTVITPDTHSNLNTPHHFRLSVPEGHRARVFVTPLFQDKFSSGTGVLMNSEKGINEVDAGCGEYKGGYAPESNTAGSLSPLNSMGEMIVPADDSSCDMSSWLLNHKFATEAEVARPFEVEVLVVFEPLANAEYDPGQTPPEPVRLNMTTAQPIEGGTGFNDAVEIKDGAYSDTIVPGEYRFFKVPVAVGQRAVVQVAAPEVSVNQTSNLFVGIYDALRGSQSSEGLGIGVENDKVSMMAFPAGFEGVYVDQSGTPGYHFIGFQLSESYAVDGIKGVDQPFTFTVQVVGEPKDDIGWRPTYEPGPAPAHEPIAFTPRVAQPSASATQPAASESAEEAAAAAPEGEEGQNMFVTAFVALLGLLLLGVIGKIIAGRIRRT